MHDPFYYKKLVALLNCTFFIETLFHTTSETLLVLHRSSKRD